MNNPEQTSFLRDLCFSATSVLKLTTVKTTRLSLLVIALILVFSSPCRANGAGNANAVPALPAYVADANSLSLVRVWPELGFDAYHVQGIAFTGGFFYITGTDKHTSTAWIFKVDAKTSELVKKKDITQPFAWHPSGIDFDGENIWVAVAVYDENSRAHFATVDPDTLKTKFLFKYKDHIGAVTRYKDMLIGANWDAKDFYFFSLDGKLIEKRPSPTGKGYQDCKRVDGFLMCTGGGVLDWIHIDTWTLAKRFSVGESETGEPLSREGAALYNGHVYFLPDDGPTSKIYEFEFSNNPPE